MGVRVRAPPARHPRGRSRAVRTRWPPGPQLPTCRPAGAFSSGVAALPSLSSGAWGSGKGPPGPRSGCTAPARSRPASCPVPLLSGAPWPCSRLCGPGTAWHAASAQYLHADHWGKLLLTLLRSPGVPGWGLAHCSPSSQGPRGPGAALQGRDKWAPPSGPHQGYSTGTGLCHRVCARVEWRPRSGVQQSEPVRRTRGRSRKRGCVGSLGNSLSGDPQSLPWGREPPSPSSGEGSRVPGAAGPPLPGGEPCLQAPLSRDKAPGLRLRSNFLLFVFCDLNRC